MTNDDTEPVSYHEWRALTTRILLQHGLYSVVLGLACITEESKLPCYKRPAEYLMRDVLNILFDQGCQPSGAELLSYQNGECNATAAAAS